MCRDHELRFTELMQTYKLTESQVEELRQFIDEVVKTSFTQGQTDMLENMSW